MFVRQVVITLVYKAVDNILVCEAFGNILGLLGG